MSSPLHDEDTISYQTIFGDALDADPHDRLVSEQKSFNGRRLQRSKQLHTSRLCQRERLVAFQTSFTGN
jgi:hypothetical protein